VNLDGATLGSSEKAGVLSHTPQPGAVIAVSISAGIGDAPPGRFVPELTLVWSVLPERRPDHGTGRAPNFAQGRGVQ